MEYTTLIYDNHLEIPWEGKFWIMIFVLLPISLLDPFTSRFTVDPTSFSRGRLT